MATAASVTADLTTCPICLELFDNPKSLPCLHAFCLKCLQCHFTDKFPGGQASCPMCRKDFQIPSDGLDGLQHHFFLQCLVEVQKASSKNFGDVLCEVCLEECNENSDTVPAPIVHTATMCCLDCGQSLCDQCSRPHRWMKGGAHHLKRLGAEAEQEVIQLRASSCKKHPDEQVKLYCCDCNENICLMCSAVKHRNHNSTEIPEAAENFRVMIVEDDQQIVSDITTVRELSDKSKQTAAEFIGKFDSLEKKVVEIGDEIKRLVDRQVSDMLQEFTLVKSENSKRAESVQSTFQLALVRLESFHTYVRELLMKGRPSDITRAAQELHKRAAELLESDITEVKYRPPHVIFTPADVAQLNCLNLIGKLCVTPAERSEPELPAAVAVEPGEQVTKDEVPVTGNLRDWCVPDEPTHGAGEDKPVEMPVDNVRRTSRESPRRSTIRKDSFRLTQLSEEDMKNLDMGRVIQTLPEGEPVMGVTSLDKHLYVLRAYKSASQIEVYDLVSYRLLRCLTVPGLGVSEDIVACASDQSSYVFVSDHTNHYIHRVAFPGEAVSGWRLNERPARLSVTVLHTLLVVCDEARKIKEFTTEGRLFRDIQLPQDVASPWHAVQFPGGELVVCHGAMHVQLHRVCLLGSDGEVARYYGGPKGPGAEHLNMPAHLAYDPNNFVFVADQNNGRVLLLSPSLAYVREVVSHDKLKWKPRRLHLDAIRCRLYIADNEARDGKFTTGRVVVTTA